MIIAVGNTKGGVGKTTVAVNLSLAFALAGRNVWMVDGDSQGTAKIAADIRAASGFTPALPCVACPDGPALRAQIQAHAGRFDDVVLDVGGRDSSALRAALLVADALLVPYLPRSFDVWALQQVGRLVMEAGRARPGLKAWAFLNCADPGGRDNADAAAAVAGVPALEYLAAPLSRRKAFANAAGSGRCVHELKPKDAKAANELTALQTAIMQWRM